MRKRLMSSTWFAHNHERMACHALSISAKESGSCMATKRTDEMLPRNRRYSDGDLASDHRIQRDRKLNRQRTSIINEDCEISTEPNEPVRIKHRQSTDRESQSQDDESEVESSIEDTGMTDFIDDLIDEKLRPFLVPGDDVSDIYDCLRIDAMDSCPGVFLLSNAHMYIVDNYQRAWGQEGEPSTQSNAGNRVVEVERSSSQVQRDLSMRFQLVGSDNDEGLVRDGTSSLMPSSSIHQCRSLAYDDITELHKRRYQLRHVALEVFAHSGRNFLVRTAFAVVY